ncbi:PhzF family phenazine biosynthesis protein [Pseudomonas syringae group genomosp. 3]|uniref:PhzF family phenazine biosynthesis protein n=1 Tax=Pseudomonas syringae group genomosp. 3 TaxID=251701 RepID=UPI000EFB2F81|nr:PhzF family phenazine biosynthesis protein [Pseudomonas syringae group genomosp. 3]
MRLQMFQVDAFSNKTLNGNPAAVCPLDAWLADDILLAVAGENNLAETAYFVKTGEGVYKLRWFTPELEIDLCGHATLATAWVIFEELGVAVPELRFNTRGGELRVVRNGDVLTMDFPATTPVPVDEYAELLAALGVQSTEVLVARDYIVVLDSEEAVAAVSPDFAALEACTTFGASVTARGSDVDFVSRWFGPKIGVDEDITTGAAHAWLAPYWAGQLGKQTLTAIQGGKRKGNVTCEVAGDRVLLSGNASTYLVGEIRI